MHSVKFWYKSSHRSCSIRKRVFRNFAKFKKIWFATMFYYEFCEISKNTFFTEHHRATVEEYDEEYLNMHGLIFV